MNVVPLTTVIWKVPLYAAIPAPEITAYSPVAKADVLATVYVARDPVPLVAVTASVTPGTVPGRIVGWLPLTAIVGAAWAMVVVVLVIVAGITV